MDRCILREVVWESCALAALSAHICGQVPKMFRFILWAPMIGLIHVQPDLQKRHYNNAKHSGHNEHTNCREKLSLCNAAQPALDAKVVVEEAKEYSMVTKIKKKRLQSGLADMLHGYRYMPDVPIDQDTIMVPVPDKDNSRALFQLYDGVLFGQNSSVSNENRWT